MTGQILVKSYYGWGGDLAILAEALALAEEIGFTIIVDWRGAFSNRVLTDNIFYTLFDLNAPQGAIEFLSNCPSNVFPDYWASFLFEPSPYSREYPLTRTSIDDVLASPKKPADYSIIVITRESSRFYSPHCSSAIISAYQKILPKPYLLDQINACFQSWEDRPVIGVHFRHGNGERTVYPPDIEWYFVAIDKFLSTTPNAAIFLCTDCSAAVGVFSSRYGERIIVTNKEYPEPGTGGMHYYNNREERKKSGEEAIIDMWLLSKCDFFIGTKSFFSYSANFIAGAFPREKSAWYSPKYRSFAPLPDMHLVANSELKSLLEKYGMSLQGLYYTRNGDSITLFFLYEMVDKFLISELDEIRLQKIWDRIRKIRLY